MRKILALLAVTAALALTGCAQGNYNVDSKATENVDLLFIGAPAPLSFLTLGAQGTGTPVAKDLSLTSNHVAVPLLKRKKATHALCDVALIKSNNTGKIHKLGSGLHTGDNIIMYGYSGRTSLPVSSAGVVNGFTQYEGCLVATTTAGAVQGMSGGAVLNDAGELVGIVSAINLTKGLTYIVPIQAIQPWLGDNL